MPFFFMQYEEITYYVSPKSLKSCQSISANALREGIWLCIIWVGTTNCVTYDNCFLPVVNFNSALKSTVDRIKIRFIERVSCDFSSFQYVKNRYLAHCPLPYP